MFKINSLIKHNFFGYGLVLKSNDEKTEVFFTDGKKTILNTHLSAIVDEHEYEKVYSLYIDTLNKERILKNKELEKIRLKEEQEKERQRKIEEQSKKKLKKEQEKLEKELLKRKKKEELERIQQEELDKIKKYQIYNEKLDVLSEFMLEDIYPIEKFKFYLRKNGIPLDEDIIEYSLYYLGYRMRTSDILLNNRWKSIEEYFENEVCKYDRYFYNNKFNLKIYDNILKKLEKKLVLFEATPGVYITKRLMKKFGINNYTLKFFQEEIIKIGNKFKIFTTKQVYNEIPNDKIIEFASETRQIEKFILSVPKIKSIQSDDDRYIFTFSSDKFTKPLFLEMYFLNIESIDLYSLKDKLKEEFDVLFDVDSLIYCANNSSLYYNDEMGKIYKNKETFLKEIFNE